MFQNDLSFIKKDFDKEEIDINNLSNLIKELMEEHEGYSVAAPFFYSWELNDLKDQLPSTWLLEIDESTKVPVNKIRFTIANAYFEAERYFETEEFDNVKLKGESIGRIDIADDEDEEIIVLTCEMPFSEESEMTLLELDCASGESPYKLSITAGQNFGGVCKTFACPGEFVESGNFETGNISEIEEFLKKIMSLYAEPIAGEENQPLTGKALLDRIKSLGDVSKTDLVRSCGYVSLKDDGTERLNFTAFYEALLDAKSISLG